MDEQERQKCEKAKKDFHKALNSFKELSDETKITFFKELVKHEAEYEIIMKLYAEIQNMLQWQNR